MDAKIKEWLEDYANILEVEYGCHSLANEVINYINQEFVPPPSSPPTHTSPPASEASPDDIQS